MEIPNTDMIEYLLPRYCSGEATVEECRQVEEWIRQSGENYRGCQANSFSLSGNGYDAGIIESGYREGIVFSLSKDERRQYSS